MTLMDLLANTIACILKDDCSEAAMTTFFDYLKENGWSPAYSKDSSIKTLNMLIREELPNSPETVLLDLIEGIRRRPIKLNSAQKQKLEAMVGAMKRAGTGHCEHATLGIAPFLHGGFCLPIHTEPELICLDCGLNVTLWFKTPEDFKKVLGIEIKQSKIDAIISWAKNCTSVSSSRDILNDPIAAYRNSMSKWPGKVPIKIINHKLLNSKSGL